VAVLVLLLAAAGSVVLAFSLPHGGRNPESRGGSGGGGITEAAAVQQAAAWVSQQVSRSAIVGCDPATCSALQDRGMPAANLLVLGNAAADPLHASLVVATPAVRNQYGARLGSVYAPSVIATFGSGVGQVNVLVTAPEGASAYLDALRKDVAARKAVGVQLLANQGIMVTSQARAQLAGGEVDSRLLIVLPAMASVHPIKVLGFGDPGPGASPQIPLCSVDLAGSGQAAGMSSTGYQHWMVGFMRAQLVPFSGSADVLGQGDQAVVRLTFSRPSPLGLLTQG
jgi:hypothetical protein